MCKWIYNTLDLAINFMGVLATFIIGFQANRITKSIEKHNREVEEIARRPFPVVDAIYPSKSLCEEDYENHMRFYYGNMNEEELSLNGQVYVKALNPQILEDQAIINECRDNNKRIYLTYIHGKCCMVYNNITDDIIKEKGNFIFEYCSTRIQLKNYKNFILTMKVNYLRIIDTRGNEKKVQGLENGSKKYLPISENGYVDILMCFAANNFDDTLCINDPNVYADLPDKKINILKSVVNEPMLKYKTLIFNLTFETVEEDKEPFTYDIIINWSLNGFESLTSYVP